MSKQDILDYFSDINYAYNNSTRLDTLSRMLDELVEQPASPWHRVEDKMPKDGEWVLIWGDGFHVPIQAFHESGCWLDDQFEKYTATHWMTLPEPPKEDE